MRGARLAASDSINHLGRCRWSAPNFEAYRLSAPSVFRPASNNRASGSTDGPTAASICSTNSAHVQRNAPHAQHVTTASRRWLVVTRNFRAPQEQHLMSWDGNRFIVTDWAVVSY